MVPSTPYARKSRPCASLSAHRRAQPVPARTSCSVSLNTKTVRGPIHQIDHVRSIDNTTKMLIWLAWLAQSASATVQPYTGSHERII